MKITGAIPHGSGKVRITLEDLNDLWALYNIVAEGDLCTSRTSRKVKKETSGGNVVVNMQRFVLQIQTVKVDYAPDDTVIRISGKALSSSDFIRAGQFHTLELAINDQVTVEKCDWDYNSRRVIREALNAKSYAGAGAVLISGGAAKLYLLTDETVKPCGSIGQGKSSRNAQKFYTAILEAMKNSFDLNKLKCIVIGGRSPDQQEFNDWLFDTSSKTAVKAECLSEYRAAVQGRRKQCLTGVSKGLEREHLKDLILQNREKFGLAKAVGELRALEEFESVREQGQGVYGLAEVIAADEQQAIQKLIISGDLLKGIEPPMGLEPVACRRYLSGLAQRIERAGGQGRSTEAAAVVVITSHSLAFADIRKLADIAAILKYPIPDLAPLSAVALTKKLGTSD